jgi:hypothetical protein
MPFFSQKRDISNIFDSQFKLLSYAIIKIPDSYRHSYQLCTLNNKYFYNFDYRITDKNFINTSDKLKRNIEYDFALYQVLCNIKSNDCFNFLKYKKALFTGIQGLSLAWQLKKEIFPLWKKIISFGEDYVLSDGTEGVPIISCHNTGQYGFLLEHFYKTWNPDYCLLCIKKQ